jgi:hypothetical protein
MRLPLPVETEVSRMAVRSINHVIGAVLECAPPVHCSLNHHRFVNMVILPPTSVSPETAD